MAKPKSHTPAPAKITAAQTPSEQTPLLRQTKDFVSRYATNVQFDLNIWGMRMIFGEFLTEQGHPVVDQHTSMSLPWLQVKLLIAYMELNLIGYEMENGPIKVPSRFLPTPTNPPEEMKVSNPKGYEAAKKLAITIADIRAKYGIEDEPEAK
jgi:hypothetical protein